MPTFHHSAEVDAALEAVVAFHPDPQALRKLTPLPVQIHRYEWSGSTGHTNFTVWFGPLPMRWESNFETHPSGFVDCLGRGPLETWEHTHSFTSLSPGVTRIDDDIVYRYQPGWRGWVSRLAFAPPALRILFLYRIFRTRRALRRRVTS